MFLRHRYWFGGTWSHVYGETTSQAVLWQQIREYDIVLARTIEFCSFGRWITLRNYDFGPKAR